MIIWGGYDYSTSYVNTGGKYNPPTDSWTATSTTNAPVARDSHTAIWTGNEMVVWGGEFFDNVAHGLDTGGQYNPETNSWTATSMTNAPTGRFLHTVVWTGSEMIVWGGFDSSSSPLNTGGRYNPVTDSWTAISTTNAPTGRYLHTAVWTGSEMIVWGGGDGSSVSPNSGGRYNPATDSWTATSMINAPTGRATHTAIWTGNEMIVWGGGSMPFLNTGGRYNPGTDSWIAINTIEAPVARTWHTAIWTGSEMIVWGGYGGGPTPILDTGGRYNPSTDSWTATSITNAPSVRYHHKAIWAAREMIVWGGGDSSPFSPNIGGRYCAQPPATPTPPPPLTVTISGTVSYCSNPVPGPVTNVTLSLTGDAGGSTLSDGSGNYMLSSIPAGGNYVVTPSKAALPPGSTGINTIDVVATQRHFLIIGTPLTGCRLTAADVNGDSAINTIDVVAIQRFFLVLSTGTANVGKYQFNPVSRSYPGVVSDQTGQNYDTLIFGDVASGFVH
jgi:N-acetylneuraminic acid mutarotase